MQHLRLFLVWACLWGAAIDANLPKEQGCEQPNNYMHKFDINKYLGTWYTQSRTPFFGERIARCTRQSVSRTKSKGNWTYVSKLWEIRHESTKPSLRNIPLTDLRNGTYEMQTKVDEKGSRAFVLDTDYTHYAVRYNCFDIVGYISFDSWVIETRQPNPPKKYIKKAISVLKAANLRYEDMMTVDQKNCSSIQKPKHKPKPIPKVQPKLRTRH
ncbi:uncharacterized protein Dwil_GK27627 [Drosophila willistoni]|uniref:Lipocalin/cytosolic fatty-acid binding domain-containing protein n=1 Tax=Drosophila willistoni TaxID=7260 RepID=A0A0Q9WXM6_DROWI|nr:apolipoprotein D-like [Drosophila willistoni]KRF98334.1 uncharacterized protein Dwil_GK27627 [Drosophila willistoni]